MNLALETTPPPLRADHVPAVQADGSGGALAAVSLSETDFHIESRLSEIDPPFRPPSIWQNKPQATMSMRDWQWNERSIAAFLGFAAGILIIVPLVFFLSMTTDQGMPTSPPVVSEAAVHEPVESEAPTAAAPVPVPQVATANAISAGSWFDVRSTEPVEPIEPAAPVMRETSVVPETPPAAPVAPSPGQPGDALESELSARAALAAGRLIEARAALRAAASPDTPHLWFQLAETYDPLVNREAGTAEPPAAFDKMTATDIKFARFYYQQALTHGVGAARARLDALARP